jgi:hypothetical protein
MNGARRRTPLIAVALLVAWATAAGCHFHSPRYVVVDPASVSQRNDPYWKVRPRPNLACQQSSSDVGAGR